MAKKRITKKTKRIKRIKKSKLSYRSIKRYEKTKQKGLNLGQYKPFVSCVLNFFLWGTGYIYSGRLLYGFLWLIVAILLLIPYQFILPSLTKSIANYITTGYILISALLAWDVYASEMKKRFIHRD